MTKTRQNIGFLFHVSQRHRLARLASCSDGRLSVVQFVKHDNNSSILSDIHKSSDLRAAFTHKIITGNNGLEKLHLLKCRGYEFSYITNTRIRIKSKREKIHLINRMRIIKRLDKMSAGRNIQTDHLNILLQTSELNTGTVEKVFKKWADQKRKRIIVLTINAKVPPSYINITNKERSKKVPLRDVFRSSSWS